MVRDGVKAWCRYDLDTRFGEGFGVAEVNATPAQYFGYLSGRRRDGEKNFKYVKYGYTTRTEFREFHFPVGFATREYLGRAVNFKMDDGSYIVIIYSIVDDKLQPAAKGSVRLESEFCCIAKEKEGSNGKVSTVWRMLRVNPVFGTVVGAVVGKVVAKKSVANVAKPLLKQKTDVENILSEYDVLALA